MFEFLKVSVNGNKKRILKVNSSWQELFDFQNSLKLPLTGPFKNCYITYP